MSKRDSFFKAIGNPTYRGMDLQGYIAKRKAQEILRKRQDEQWMREQGLVRGRQPGATLPLVGGPEVYKQGGAEETVLGPPEDQPPGTEWRSMPWYERAKEALVGTPASKAKQREFFGDLPQFYQEEYIQPFQRLMPMGDVPIRDKRGRVVEWVPRGEYEEKAKHRPLDPTEEAAADPLLAVLDVLIPGAGGEVSGLKKGQWLSPAFRRGDELLKPSQIRRHAKQTYAPAALADRGMALRASDPERAATYTIAADFMDKVPYHLRADLIGDSKEAMKARNAFYNSADMPQGYRPSEVTQINMALKDQEVWKDLRRTASADVRASKEHGAYENVRLASGQRVDVPARQLLTEQAREIQQRFEPGSLERRKWLEASKPDVAEGKLPLLTRDPAALKEEATRTVPLHEQARPQDPSGMYLRESYFGRHPTVEHAAYVSPYAEGRGLSTAYHEGPTGHMAQDMPTGRMERESLARLHGDVSVPEVTIQEAAPGRSYALSKQQLSVGEFEALDELARQRYYQQHYGWYPPGQGAQQELKYILGEEVVDPQEAMHIQRTRPAGYEGEGFRVEPGRELAEWRSPTARGRQLEESVAFRGERFMSEELADEARREIMETGKAGSAAREWLWRHRKNPTKRSYQGAAMTREQADKFARFIEDSMPENVKGFFTPEEADQLLKNLEEATPASESMPLFDEFEQTRIQQLFERQARGEYLSPEDAALLEQAKRNIAGGADVPMWKKMQKR